MKNRKKALIAVTAAGALLTLTACGGGGSGTPQAAAEFSEDYSGTYYDHAHLGGYDNY